MEQILREVRAAFGKVAAARPFLADWPDVAPRREVPPSNLPVCRWLAAMREEGAMAAIRQAAGNLRWQQTYGAADFGAAFLDGYGWCEFVGLRGPVACEKMACGVLILAPGMVYPAHAHEAEEVYLPISGVAEWQQGDGDFGKVAVGRAIHHASWVPHAMRTGAEPLAALYLWRGGDLAAKSVILGR